MFDRVYGAVPAAERDYYGTGPTGVTDRAPASHSSVTAVMAVKQGSITWGSYKGLSAPISAAVALVVQALKAAARYCQAGPTSRQEGGAGEVGPGDAQGGAGEAPPEAAAGAGAGEALGARDGSGSSSPIASGTCF